MRTIAAALAASALMSVAAVSAQAASAVPAAIAAAVADPARPKTDTDRDANRKPAEVVAFAGVKSGQKVADIFPGGGYFTRILAKTVGPTGKVYAFVLPASAARPTANDAIKAIAAEYGNIVVIEGPFNELKSPEPLDVAITTENYHDFKNPQMGVDTAVFDKAVLASLKKGGVFLISDHSAAPGAGTSVTGTLHRIDPESVKSEMTAAGFKLDAESKALARADDPHTARVFTLHDVTDIFMLRFKKP
jgi:predicted methyltransferase